MQIHGINENTEAAPRPRKAGTSKIRSEDLCTWRKTCRRSAAMSLNVQAVERPFENAKI